MRTRLYFEIAPPPEGVDAKAEIRKLTEVCNLAPSFEPAEVERRKEDLLKEVPETRRDQLRKSFVAVIFEPMYGSWGLVFNVSGSVYEVRMSNVYAFRLQASVARVVSALRNRSQRQKLDLTFKPEVEIFETAEDQSVYNAKILERRLWRLARTDKRVSWRLFLAAVWVIVPGLVLSMPGVSELLLQQIAGLSRAWAAWVGELAGRLAAAGLVAAAMSWLDVYLHWRHLQGVAPVLWPLEGDR